MHLIGQSAIDYLRGQCDSNDPAASSHWKFYHKNFVFHENGTFSGLTGFGGCNPPYKGLRKLYHNILQCKYRRIGNGLSAFKHIDSLALSMTQKQNRAYDLDVLRQTITLSFLMRHLPLLHNRSTVAVIGDGFASMATLLLASGCADQVILINLNKTLLVDAVYIQKWADDEFEKIFTLVTDENSLALSMNSESKIVAIQAVNHELLKHVKLNLVINIASMQEMDAGVIKAYFDDFRAISKLNELYFYCCNREEKTLPDGKVIKFSEYPWSPDDECIVDELCPWHQQYYTKCPPFYRSYDGPTRHRLTKLSSND